MPQTLRASVHDPRQMNLVRSTCDARKRRIQCRRPPHKSMKY